MRELLGRVFSRASAVALAFAGVIAGALGYLTSNWLIALIIGLSILLAVLLVLIVVHYVRRERESGLGEGLTDRDEANRQQQSLEDSSRLGALGARFQEAVDGIKSDFRSRGGVYELPWVLLIGEDGSGKSTLLAECGLDLPAQFARRGFGKTDTIEFVRANELIGIDTSGRYLACAHEQDTREWQQLLGLLRRHRPDCPIETIVFTLPVEVLLSRAPGELEELARSLRLRLNEIRVRLRVDVPVYIVATKADQLGGFGALSRLLPPQHLQQAFGWTNDQRRLPDPEKRLLEAYEGIAERLDAMLPELLQRETDPDRQRALFVLPQDLLAAAAVLARFVGVAFKKDVYSESTPFLRGVYFESARVEAAAFSPTLEHVGARGAPPVAGAGSGSLFLRDLVLEVIKGDHTLALREPSIGPLGRRAIQSAAAIFALWFLWVWGTSFWQNYQGTAMLAQSASALQSTTPSASQLEALRNAIESQELVGRSPLHWLGFRNLWSAVDDAKSVFATVFEKSIDRPTKARLRADLVKEDATGVQAAIVLASDIEWLQGEMENRDDAPQIESFAPRIARGLEFSSAYASYSRWLPQRVRDDLVRSEQEQLAMASGRLLKLPVLEEITLRERGTFPPLNRTSLGLPASSEGTDGIVPGVYTAAGIERLIQPLLTAIDGSGSVSKASVTSFKRDFAARHDEVWRAYLLDTPLTPGERAEIAESPYLALLAQVDENTKPDVPGRESIPAWLEALREVRRTLPLSEAAEAVMKGGKLKGAKLADAPWVAYKAAIDDVASKLEIAGKSSSSALALAHQVASGQPTEFSTGIEVAARIVPRGGDAVSTARLRKLLEMPFLDALSALLRVARGEVEALYRDQIVRKFSPPLSPEEQDELCGKGGALEEFVDAELAPFLRGQRPRPLLEDRAMPLGAAFAGLLSACDSIRRIPGGAAGAAGAAAAGAEGAGPGEATFTLTGVPSAVDGAPGVLVTSRVFEISCDGQVEELRYSEGSSTSKKFECLPGCDLSLRIVLADETSTQQEVSRLWHGDTACDDFLKEGKVTAGDVREWKVAGPNGSSVRARYRLSAPKPKAKPKAAPAPRSIALPGGLGE